MAHTSLLRKSKYSYKSNVRFGDLKSLAVSFRRHMERAAASSNVRTVLPTLCVQRLDALLLHRLVIGRGTFEVWSNEVIIKSPECY